MQVTNYDELSTARAVDVAVVAELEVAAAEEQVATQAMPAGVVTFGYGRLITAVENPNSDGAKYE